MTLLNRSFLNYHSPYKISFAHHLKCSSCLAFSWTATYKDYTFFSLLEPAMGVDSNPWPWMMSQVLYHCANAAGSVTLNLACLTVKFFYKCKSFTVLGPGPNVIKLILSVIYRFLNLARVFVRPDQKSLPMTNFLAHYENI